MAKRQPAYKGGFKVVDNLGEPGPASSGNTAQAFGGAPTIKSAVNRGNKQVGGPSGPTYPAPFGGGTPIFSSPTPKVGRGDGANIGAGQTTGPDV